MVSGVNGVNGVTTIHVQPPEEYEKYEYMVEVDGKKQIASIEKDPKGNVTIKTDDGNEVKTIHTDYKGLLEFNKKHMPPQKIYNSKQDDNANKEEELSLYGKFMRNLALASMYMANRRNSMQNLQMINSQNDMMQNQFIAQQMHDMAQQAHMTAVQMTTPGMGII